ncbi:CAP Gly-rich domain-containing protein [Chytriomyces sp. MP71]|nr:CAP Gly-rich domain-containing protein [Chytriomyces sp. MP71]
MRTRTLAFHSIVKRRPIKFSLPNLDGKFGGSNFNETQRSSDYFALNPPPPTGNHLDSGTRWWWGSGPNLAGHLPNSMPAPKPRNHTAVNPTPYLAELAAKPPAVPTAIQQALPPLNVKDTVASTQPEESKVGDRVCVVINGGRVLGMVKYVGMFDPHPSSGLWCGIKLDRPLGTHDGVVRGKRYFKCEENHGLFVKIDKIISVGHAHGQRIATVTHGSLLV